ncbi:hypothetical protein EVAR_57595_1 [Eumeta japonica]|uniref:Uncharacterized protein n=1 Tax=Eumeta variegata TaxID=151549 RepID=A0A4C1Y133_EUMVA|nr:hypothetical protein EVAR_57595_1 [Eumeta japonica]
MRVGRKVICNTTDYANRVTVLSFHVVGLGNLKPSTLARCSSWAGHDHFCDRGLNCDGGNSLIGLNQTHRWIRPRTESNRLLVVVNLFNGEERSNAVRLSGHVTDASWRTVTSSAVAAVAPPIVLN